MDKIKRKRLNQLECGKIRENNKLEELKMISRKRGDALQERVENIINEDMYNHSMELININENSTVYTQHQSIPQSMGTVNKT